MENRVRNARERRSPWVRQFDAEAIGLSLREVGADVIRGETTDFLSRWYHSKSPEGTPGAELVVDLVVWTDDRKRIIKQQLCVYGQVVEWTPIYGTRTGFIFEEEIGQTDAASETIRYDRSPLIEAVRQANVILSFVPKLDEELRGHLVFNLRRSPRLHKNARERAVREWSPKIEEIISEKAPSFWGRLKTWVLGHD